VERDANYAAVGAFVLLLVAMAGLFVYWYSEGRERQSYARYEIYFPGSVTGLSPGSSVRYLGVEVGKVRRIRLDPRSPERVQVIADIDESAPISETTAATLSMLSFATGLLYVDLRQNNEADDMVPPVPSEEYPVINTARSGFDAFLSSLPDVAGNIADLLERAQEIFSEENTAMATELLQSLHKASAGLPATVGHIDALLADLGQTSAATRRLAMSLHDTTGEVAGHVNVLAERLNSTAAQLEEVSVGVRQFVDENRAGVAGFTQQGLPQLQVTLESAEAALDEVRELARSLKENPSQLLYRGTPGGVEVPR
jgi:phospholipid/cholesterol/gamma-HCH transport system substrate-binding protein